MSQKIIVPATSANLGCGFDSIGIALNLSLQIEIGAAASTWQIKHDCGPQIPTDETNLIIQTALQLVPNLPAHQLKMTSDIPLEHGLGSSSSAIVAGIKLALALSDLNLTLEEQLNFACQIEGHPDNVVPALLGGLQVASYDSISATLTYSTLPAPNCAMIAFVPDYSLSTKLARQVLPDTYSRAQAVQASSKANVLVVSLASQNLILAGQMMESDLFHEKYRVQLIPELTEIRQLAHQYGAYATYLSGAGSTIMTWLPAKNSANFIQALRQFKQTHPGQILNLNPDLQGARII